MAFGDFTVVRSTVKRVLNSSGVLAEVAINTPAFEFNTDGTYRGLLVEPAATNQIRNNTMAGAVVGTPGTLPTNWGVADTAGLVSQVVAVSVINGVEYIRVRFSGTASATTLRLSTDGSIVSSSGQTYTASSYVGVFAQPTPANSYAIEASAYNLSATRLEGTATSFANTALSRISATHTIVNINGVRVRNQFVANLTISNTYDFTVDIGLPQMELGSVATSVIKTSGTSITRTADSVTLTGASSLIGATEGTLYAEVNTRITVGTAGKRILSLSDGTVDNRIEIIKATNDGITLFAVAGGVTQVNETYSSNLSGILKIAVRYANNAFFLHVGGALRNSDLSATVPTCSEIRIGNSTGGTLQFNDCVRAVALFPTSLSEAQANALTA